MEKYKATIRKMHLGIGSYGKCGLVESVQYMGAVTEIINVNYEAILVVEMIGGES